MRRVYELTLFIILLLYTSFSSFAKAEQTWINDLRNLYISGNAIIYGINIRTFAAKDIDGDGIIIEQMGEERGNFLNAIKRLDRIAQYGFNTINILPIQPIGKIKALGTAGSLYAPSSFNEINPQLKAPKSSLSLEAEMTKFVEECHKRNMRVIVDLPSYASYELYTKKPNLFIKNAQNQPITIPELPDVRFLNSGEDFNINNDVYKLYSDFFQMVINIGVDGVKVNSAELMSKVFWHRIIKETRISSPQFLFIADTQNMNLFKKAGIKTISVNDLLEAGFDGYTGNYNNYFEWTNANDLYKIIRSNIDIEKRFNNVKKSMADFTTHYQQSPILINGDNLSRLIIWLQSTLPVNAYYIDGFATGDTYTYKYANKQANNSLTDNFTYFVNRGKLDIYNFSRRPEGEFKEIESALEMGNSIKTAIAKSTQKKDSFITFRTNNNEVFAYGRDLGDKIVLVVGNLNFRKENSVTLCVNYFNNNYNIIPLSYNIQPKYSKINIVKMELKPGEVFIGLVAALQD